MKIGKLPNDLLKSIILDKIENSRSEVLIGPKIGEDCSALDFGKDTCVLSTDPITGAVHEIGRLAVHVTCNDIATCGVNPIGILINLLAPAGTTIEEISTIMNQVCDTAKKNSIDILGGHTEITEAVNRFVVVSTAVGKAPKNGLVSTSGAKPGDLVIMTKTAGLEGTAILAMDRELQLRDKLTAEEIDTAKSFLDHISVIPEGVLGGKFGVHAMHDATEGGVIGAVWELAEASGVGLEIFKDRIPVRPETVKICQIYSIDPLKLISSGCMIMTSDRGEELVTYLKSNGINAEIIGRVTEGPNKNLVGDGWTEEIGQPREDELFNI